MNEIKPINPIVININLKEEPEEKIDVKKRLMNIRNPKQEKQNSELMRKIDKMKDIIATPNHIGGSI